MTAQPKEAANPPGAPRWRVWLRRLGIVAVGALTGALVARLVGELWPLSWALANPSGLACWAWSPFFRLFCVLAGALALPLSLSLLGCGAAQKHGAWTCAWPLVVGTLYLAQPLRLPIWGVSALVAGLGGTLWLCTHTASVPRIPWPGRGTKARAGWPWLGDVLVFVLALALYLSTLASSVLPGDSGEFQLVAPTLGIPHPTGYPLYLLLGKGLSLLPLRSVAYRLNLLSALAAAGAVWAVYRAGRALRLRQAAAMVGAGLLAVSSTLWSQATIAEKYTLNAFFVALTLWLGLQWRRARLAGDGRVAPANRVARRWLYAWAVCYGLSLTHHRTMLVLAPAYALLVWTTDPRLVRDWRLVLRLLLLGSAPLSLYLLLPLFSALNPPYAYQRIDSARAFFDLVLARDYRGSLFRGGWVGLWPQLAEAGRLLVRQFGWPGMVVSCVGCGVVWRRDLRAAGVLLLGMGAQFLFALNYHVPNTYVYYLPVYVWLVVCAAAGVDAVLRTAKAVATNAGTPVRSNGFSRLGPHLTLACVLLAAAWVVYLADNRWAGMNQGQAYRQQDFDEDYGRMAARSVTEGALIVADWMPATVLWYTQTIEGLMPGAQVTVADPLDSLWQGPVQDALAAGRAVYLARPVMGAGDRFALSSAGPLVQVLDQRHFSAPLLSNPVAPGAGPDAAANAEIALLGADVLSGAGTETVIKGGDTLHATLVWQARRAPSSDYGVQVRWVDASGYVWLEQQSRHPVGGTYPTSRWQEGEVVADYYALDLPAHLGAGEYRLQAALALHREADIEWTTVATLDLGAAPGGMPPLGTQVRMRFGSGRLLTGYDAPPEWVPGETATLALQRLTCGAIERDSRGGRVRPQVWLVNREGAVRAIEPVATALIGRAQSVEWVRFVVEDDLAYVELRGSAPFGLGEERFRLPVQVADAPPGANFDNKLRLRSYAYQAETYRPGETVRLTLEWETMRAMDEAYKVFVHVLGPNGLPVAQQDNEPLNGTYSTTRWQRGERVSDPYAIALPADLPPGEYAVEVGLYRISDLTRLPVLDAEQQFLDDKLFLTPLVVQ